MPEKKSTPSRVAKFLEASRRLRQRDGRGEGPPASIRPCITVAFSAMPNTARRSKRCRTAWARRSKTCSWTAPSTARERQLFWRGKPVKTRDGHLVYEVDYDNQPSDRIGEALPASSIASTSSRSTRARSTWSNGSSRHARGCSKRSGARKKTRRRAARAVIGPLRFQRLVSTVRLLRSDP